MAKTVSSWKSKKRYTILAPDNFEGKELGETISSKPESMIGRTVDTSLGSIVGDRGKQYLKLVFQISEVKGDTVLTKFKKFFIPTGYLRSKVRKGTSKLDYIKELKFKEGKARFKLMILTRSGISDDQKTALYREIDGVLEAHQSDKLDHAVQLTLFGKMGTEVYKRCKSIMPITRVEIYEISSK
ncbi:MAG: 30S ribosomal protein S3ae [Candidatus Altiarchaeota archaeon]